MLSRMTLMTKINSQNSHEAIQMWWCVSEVSALLGEMGGVTRRTAWGLSSWLAWSTRYSAETRGSRPEEGKKRTPTPESCSLPHVRCGTFM